MWLCGAIHCEQYFSVILLVGQLLLCDMAFIGDQFMCSAVGSLPRIGMPEVSSLCEALRLGDNIAVLLMLPAQSKPVWTGGGEQ